MVEIIRIKLMIKAKKKKDGQLTHRLGVFLNEIMISAIIKINKINKKTMHIMARKALKIVTNRKNKRKKVHNHKQFMEMQGKNRKL
jgi:hypothetical protein